MKYKRNAGLKTKNFPVAVEVFGLLKKGTEELINKIPAASSRKRKSGCSCFDTRVLR